jgi:error-prone DNA polymerase
MTDYVELTRKLRIQFSSRRGDAGRVDGDCAELNMPAMALLDNDGLYGSARFHLAAQKLGVKAHIGAEITVSSFRVSKFQVQKQVQIPNSKPDSKYQIPNSKFQIQKSRFQIPNQIPDSAPRSQSHRLSKPLPADHFDEVACAETCEAGRVRGYADELAEYAEGLVCLTGDADDGPLAKALTTETQRAQRKHREERSGLIDVFGKGNVYAELQRHFNREEEARNQAVIEIAAV